MISSDRSRDREGSPEYIYSHTILVFFHTKRHGNIPTDTPFNGGIECRWGRQD